MYRNSKFIAIIPARGGSKGIPGKNIININNKPLINYTIDAAKKSKYLDRIVVSTDDTKIAEVSINCGADVPFLRPQKFAEDESKTIDAILYTINKFKKSGQEYEYIVLLQPTQPLRQEFHIDEAIEYIVNQNAESLVSVTEVKEHPILMRSMDDFGTLQPLIKSNSTIRRQEFSKYYKVNGAIYINKIETNLNEYTSFNDNELGYLMENKYDLDIDDYFDLELFKLKLRLLEQGL